MLLLPLVTTVVLLVEIGFVVDGVLFAVVAGFLSVEVVEVALAADELDPLGDVVSDDVNGRLDQV